jgi:hypothetical protein
MYGLANPAADAADKMKQPHDDKDPELPVVRWRAASIAASYSLATWVIVMRLQLLSHRIEVPESGWAPNLLAVSTSLFFGAQVLTVLFQNFLFSPFGYKARTEIAFIIIALVHMLFLGAFYSTEKPESHSVVWIAVGMVFLGIGRGLAESNSFAFFAPFGAETQQQAVWGKTTAWLVAAGGYFALDAIFPNSTQLSTVAHVFIIVALFINGFLLQRLPAPAVLDTIDKENWEKARSNVFASDGAWIAEVRWEIVLSSLTTALATFSVIFSQIVYLRKWQTLFGGVHVSPAVFLVLTTGAQLVGGSMASFTALLIPRPRIVAIISGVIGLALLFSRVPILALLSGGFIWGAFALSVAVLVNDITTKIGRDHVLLSLCAWLVIEKACVGIVAFAAHPYANVIGESG